MLTSRIIYWLIKVFWCMLRFSYTYFCAFVALKSLSTTYPSPGTPGYNVLLFYAFCTAAVVQLYMISGYFARFVQQCSFSQTQHLMAQETPQIVASCIAHIRFQFWMYSDACLLGRWEIPRPSTRIWICCWSPQWQSLKPVWRRWRSLPALPISWPLSGLRNRFPEYHWVFAVNFLHLH